METVSIIKCGSGMEPGVLILKSESTRGEFQQLLEYYPHTMNRTLPVWGSEMGQEKLAFAR